MVTEKGGGKRKGGGTGNKIENECTIQRMFKFDACIGVDITHSEKSDNKKDERMNE